jgi:hypothetical protein
MKRSYALSATRQQLRAMPGQRRDPMKNRQADTCGDGRRPLFGEQFTKAMELAPTLAAPERHDEMQRLLEHHDIHVAIDDGVGFVAEIDIDSRRVSLSERACVRLWCHCYAYQVALEQHKASSAAGGRVWNPGGEAARMLTWADRSADEAWEPWSRGLPRPEKKYVTERWASPRIIVLALPSPPQLPTAATLSGRATRKLIGAVGWILLHEIAHLYYGHRPYSNKPLYESTAEEQQADHNAVTWLFGSDSLGVVEGLHPGTVENRLMAIAFALCFLCAEEITPFDRTVKFHVDAFARLWRFLRTFLRSNDHDGGIQARVWRQVTVILAGLLQHRGFPTMPTADFGSTEFVEQAFEICGGRLV